jgi:hypothetical protein
MRSCYAGMSLPDVVNALVDELVRAGAARCEGEWVLNL